MSKRTPAMVITAVIKAVSIVSVFIFFIGLGQFAQAFHASDDVRYAAINEWVTENPDKKQLAENYIEQCLKGIKPSIKEVADNNSKPFGVYDCADAIGANDLAQYVGSKVRVLRSLAWPLSIIE